MNTYWFFIIILIFINCRVEPIFVCVRANCPAKTDITPTQFLRDLTVFWWKRNGPTAKKLVAVAYILNVAVLVIYSRPQRHPSRFRKCTTGFFLLEDRILIHL